MKRAHFAAALVLMALILIIPGCATQSVKQEPRDAPSTITAVEKKQGWELEWENTVSEARKEKKVIIATGQTATVREALSQGFKKAYNIEAEFIVGSGQELSNRITMQYRAGIAATDIILTGNTTIVQVLKPQGFFEPLGPHLILPDVRDTRNWYENKIQYADKEGKVLFIVLSPSLNLYANSNLVGKDEIRAYKDVINPKWQGKLVMADPTVPGTGQEFIFLTLKSYGVEFLRDLVKQNPVIIRNDRLQAEWVAQGKYHIGIGGAPIAQEFEKDGAPIFFPSITEGQNTLSIGFGGFAFFKGPPHPQAARVFINWLFSKEGQLAYSKTDGRQSVRVDVPTDHLISFNIRKPGISYIKSSDEENLLIRDDNMKTAKEVFGPLLR